MIHIEILVFLIVIAPTQIPRYNQEYKVNSIKAASICQSYLGSKTSSGKPVTAGIKSFEVAPSGRETDRTSCFHHVRGDHKRFFSKEENARHPELDSGSQKLVNTKTSSARYK